MKLGKFELYPISDGHFWLDGGAMYGAVPKVLWDKVSPSDGQNRIKLAVNCLLIKADGKCILVDTGIGDKFSKKLREVYKIDRDVNLIASLARYGVKPQDIDYVINTHLHFDHCGSNTSNSGGKYLPTFGNAKYFIQQQEWFSAQNTDERTRSSYRASDFLPLEAAGQVEFVDGDFEIVRGIKVLLTNGHTLGHQSVLIDGGNGSALYLGDIIPTVYHLKPHYLTSYDLYPVDLIARKKQIVEDAVREDHLLVFEHDPKIVFARLRERQGSLKVEVVGGEGVVQKRKKTAKKSGRWRKKRLSG
ncbi:MAG: MBL fold metallo-hydrolase [candidate division WOR-3 bacterium]|nr:MAG: MBL fold metallo-hydrolase [candidate division WOR-3 bacterium]